MKKKKNIEMKIYELLGVKIFRKMAFGLRNILAFPFTIGMSKEERKHFLYNTASNYNIGKISSLETIKKFKKELLINASIHFFGLYVCLPNFIKIVSGTASISTTIINLTCIGINLYCIMLQRYNFIRINQLIKKTTPKYELQKEKIKEELRKEDSLLEDHLYKIIDKKERETNITLEDLIESATIEQLKQYREYLAYCQSVNQEMLENESYGDELLINISLSLNKQQTLKLEFKNKKHDNSANN